MDLVKIIEKQQEVCGIIMGMNQATLFLLILNLLNITQVLLEKHQKIMIDSQILPIKLAILLKYLSDLWRSSNISLSNCEVELILIWSKNCVLVDMRNEMQKMVIQQL